MSRQDSNGFTTLKPAEVKLSSQQESAVSEEARQRTPDPARYLALATRPQVLIGGGLLLLIVFVFFVLPDWTSPAEDRLVITPAKATPYQEILDARRDFTERSVEDQKLREIANLQLELEKLGADDLGQPDFNQALRLAQQGDALAQKADWERAGEKYDQARTMLQSLHERWGAVLEAKAIEIFEAINARQFATARTELARLQKHAPEYEAIPIIERQLHARPQVNELLKKADAFYQTGQLEEALRFINMAAQIEPHHPPVQIMAATIKEAVTEQQFQKAMSAGLNSLEAGDLQKALTAFQQAAKIKSGAAAQEGIQETQRRLKKAQIQALEVQAQQARQAEDWQEAATLYQQALALDNNITHLRDSLKYSQSRIEMSERIESLIADKAELAKTNRLKQARQILKLAGGLEGAHLQRQLERLRAAIAIATRPIQLTLVSDRQTSVHLYRVGKLGTFKTRTLSLKPGEYTVKGSRRGYRDVVHVVKLPAGAQPKSLTVQCEEPI